MTHIGAIMLEIIDLHVEAGGREILKGVSLKISEGETCVLFGPNGSGKSTLLAAIMGYRHCKVTSGKIMFKGQDITEMGVDERARLGIGMMMQRPPNVSGVKLGDLVKEQHTVMCQGQLSGTGHSTSARQCGGRYRMMG